MRRFLIEEQLAHHEFERLLDEGIWDDAKSGLLRLVGAVRKKFPGGQQFVAKIKETIAGLGGIPDHVKTIMGAIKQGMSETGERIALDKALQQAKELGKLTIDQATAAAEADLQGPVHSKAVQLNREGRLVSSLEKVMTGVSRDMRCLEARHVITETRRLNEAGLISMAGLGLAVMGAVPMLLKALMKFARLLGAERVANILERAYHVAHHFEEKAIDWIVPDALSYVVYKTLQARGIKTSKQPLDKESYVAGAEGAKKKVEGLMYSALLVFFAINGIKAALHAGYSLLGVTEGAATAVKGIEIGGAGAEAAALVRAAGTAL